MKGNCMKILKTFKEHYILISSVVGIFIAVFMWGHNLLNQYDNIQETLKTTQQMSLKSVIWNESIPLSERASACDVYLTSGYNSLTKKECSKIIEEIF